MKCPKCNNGRTQVTDSRDGKSSRYRRRRRYCEKCKHRFTTTELIGIRDDELPLLVSEIEDRDNKKVPFDANRLRASIENVFKHSNYSIDAIEQVYEKVFDKITNMDNQKKITYKDINEMIVAELKIISKLIAIRYASVHLEFNNEKELFDFINKK